MCVYTSLSLSLYIYIYIYLGLVQGGVPNLRSVGLASDTRQDDNTPARAWIPFGDHP